MKPVNRPLIVLLAAVFLLAALPLSTPAADQPPVTLQKAIQIAKLNFKIPESYTEFTSRFSDYENSPAWSLSWRPKDGSGSSFSVDVNANTGEITGMNFYQPDDSTNFAVRIPSYSVDEAAKISESFLQKIIPNRMKELRLVSPLKQSENTYHSLSDYVFYWQRTVNNIPVQGERAAVGVNKFNGTVVSYQLNCTTSQFPSSSGVITASQAEKAFKDTGMFELQYLVPPQYRPLNQEEAAEPVLVYRLTHKSGGMIDAKTGKPFIVPSGQYLQGLDIYMGAVGRAEKQALAMDQAGSVELSPEEQEEIIKHANLLTQQEACQVVFQWVPAARDMSLRNAYLEAVYGQPQNRNWILSFTKKDENGKDHRVYARLDAASGEIQYFSYSYPRDSFAKEKAKSPEVLEKTARDFLKRASAKFGMPREPLVFLASSL